MEEIFKNEICSCCKKRNKECIKCIMFKKGEMKCLEYEKDEKQIKEPKIDLYITARRIKNPNSIFC